MPKDNGNKGHQNWYAVGCTLSKGDGEERDSYYSGGNSQSRGGEDTGKSVMYETI